MDLSVRTVAEDELDAYWRVLFTAFGEEPTEERKTDENDWAEHDRSIVAVDGDRIVGTAGAYSFAQTLPGGATVPVAGVTCVGVLPTHRRRGALSAMMRFQLDDVIARGEPMAILTASEASIYGRFGYGVGVRLRKAVVDTRRGLGLRSAPETGGTLRLLGSDEVRPVLAPLQDEVRRHRHGDVSRPARWWDVHLRDRSDWRDGASHRFDVVHERGGVVDGALSYRVKQGGADGVHANEVVLGQLLTTDSVVELALLDYAAEIDLTGALRTWARPADDPLPYAMTDARRYRTVLLFDHIYNRVLDVERVLSARTYEAAADLVLAIDDPFLPACGGRFRLVAGDDGTATCERLGDIDGGDADLRMDVAALGCLVLGDLAPSLLAAATRLTPSSEAAVHTADRVFPTARSPYCGFEF